MTHRKADRDVRLARALDLGSGAVKDVAEEEDPLADRELVRELGCNALLQDGQKMRGVSFVCRA